MSPAPASSIDLSRSALRTGVQLDAGGRGEATAGGWGGVGRAQLLSEERVVLHSWLEGTGPGRGAGCGVEGEDLDRGPQTETSRRDSCEA